ncbi:hypothetical protein GF323_05420 [Candidatus Woesearchaeota archaeon]|nr:hypothetical protein [Candidatus Woesearchaeota archaeon]
MVSKEFLKDEINKIENTFRQKAEEKPYLIHKEKKFYKEAKSILEKDADISSGYVKNWLRGYRKRKFSKL